MSKFIERLVNSTFYPVSEYMARTLLEDRGLNPDGEFSEDMRRAYELAQADLYLKLSTAPSISQANFSVTISDAQRDEYKMLANSLYQKNGEQLPTKEIKPIVQAVMNLW